MKFQQAIFILNVFTVYIIIFLSYYIAEANTIGRQFPFLTSYFGPQWYKEQKGIYFTFSSS